MKDFPDSQAVSKARRRARQFGIAINTLTLQEWRELKTRYNNTCLACGRTDVKLTIDHIVPFSYGGRNAIDNVQPLCKPCNSRKHDQIVDYRAILEYGYQNL